MATTVARLEAILGADTKEFDRKMDSSDRRIHQSGQHFGKTTERMGTFAKAGGLAVAGGFALAAGSVIKTGVEFANMREQAQIAFTTMLHSGTKAKAFLDDLQKFAARTPFEFPGLVKSSQKLLAMGFTAKQVVPTLTAIGDAVAGLGGGPEVLDRVTVALGQMQAKGKASSEEMMQLTEAGIPAWRYLAKTLNTDVATAMQMVTKRQVDATTAIKAVTTGMNRDFGGMMDKQSRTLAGLWSTAKDTFSQIAGTLLQPMLPLLKSVLSGMLSVAQAVPDLIGKAVNAVGPTIVGIRKTVEENWPKIRQIAQNVFGWIRSNVYPIIQGLRDIFVQAVQRITAVLQANGPELHRIFDRIGSAIKAIAVVAIPILRVAFVDVLPRAIGVAITVLDKVTGAIAGIIKIAKRIGEEAKPIVMDLADAFHTVYNWIHKAVTATKNLLDQIGKFKGPSGIDVIKGLFGGDAEPDLHLKFTGGPKDLHGALPVMRPFAAEAASFGLHISAGRTDHAKYTKHGTISDHWYGKALDETGSASGMAGFFRALVGNPLVKQAFYDPLGSIFGGRWSSYREGGHSNHVHVATYDQGGFLQPGWNLAYNGLGVPERVGGGSVTIPVYVGGQHLVTVVWDELRRKAKVFEQRNGRPAFGAS